MNYKLATYLLLAVVVITYSLHWKDIFNHSSSHSSDMHMMADGTMMHNEGSDMHSMMMDMTARMKGKSGDELDKVFLEDMITHHQGAVDMAKLLVASTKRPELKKFGNDIISLQTSEIEMQKKWLKEWFNK